MELDIEECYEQLEKITEDQYKSIVAHRRQYEELSLDDEIDFLEGFHEVTGLVSRIARRCIQQLEKEARYAEPA